MCLTSALYVSAGAVIGALARYYLAGFIMANSQSGFPLGTLIVNLSGCAIIGLLWSASEAGLITSGAKTFLFVGMLGAYTTFSSFGLETFGLMRDGRSSLAFTYVLLSNLGGFTLVYLGWQAGKRIFS